jgi:hypothetical protein
MRWTEDQVKYLKAWAIEEMHDPHGPAHQLQESHGATDVPLVTLFRAWTSQERLDPVAVTALLEGPPPEAPITWPWDRLASFQEGQHGARMDRWPR